MAISKPQSVWVYVASYLTGDGAALHIYEMDLHSGNLTPLGTAAGVQLSYYLTADPERRILFATDAAEACAGAPGGAVASYAIDRANGALTFLNHQSAGGSETCYLSVAPNGKFVLVANYTGGNLAVLPVRSDGQLGQATSLVNHEGSSINADRQEGPHPHSVLFDPQHRFALSADLGADKIFIYRFDSDTGTLTPNDPPHFEVTAGAGPRHMVFHPNHRVLYVINELHSTVNAMSYDASSGTLRDHQTISALPDGYSGQNDSADIHVHPSGRFLYGSNRGHESIVIFRIDEQSGTLSLVGHESIQGEFPRGFGIDPTGTFLLTANEHTDTIVTFRIDPTSGRLTPTGKITQVPQPASIRFVSRFA